MNKKEEIEKLKQILIKKVKTENDARYVNLSSDEIMKIITESSNKGKYLLWIIREYIKNNIQRFEDMDRVKQALSLFNNNLSKLSEQQKQLNKMSFQELETLVEPYQEVLTQNEIKRMNKEKIWSEIETIYSGPNGRIYNPKTKEASVFLGQGTKWCTAAINNNMFDYYNKKGPLYIFVLSKKDEDGREIKYQFHFETEQFMDMKDVKIKTFDDDLTKLMDCLFNYFCIEQKNKYFIQSDMFFKLFNKKEDFVKIYEELLIEKIKINDNFEPTVDVVGKTTMKILCEFIVKKNGNLLCFIPNELQTKKICEISVKNNGESLSYVCEELKTAELCEIALRKYGKALNFVPEKLITPELCEIAIKNDVFAFCYIPKKIITKELCELAVDYASIINTEQEINSELSDKENKQIHDKKLKEKSWILKSIPDEFKTKKLCEKFAKQNGYGFQFVPEEFKTKELCDLVLKQNFWYLRAFPDVLVTPELCKIAVEQNGIEISHVPHDMLTKELCEIAVSNNHLAFLYVPEKFKTKELYELAVKKNGSALGYVPKEFRTKELCVLAVQQNGEVLKYVPHEFKTQEMCEIAVRQNGQSLCYVPNKFKTKELCEIALLQNVETLKHVPDEFKENKMLESIIKFELLRNQMIYSFDEAVKMMFELEDNPVKKIFKNIKNEFEEHYLDMVITELNDKLNSKSLLNSK